jgi:hypothetical protein
LVSEILADQTPLPLPLEPAVERDCARAATVRTRHIFIFK